MYQRKDGRCVGEYTDWLGKRRYVSGKNKTEVKAKIKTKLKEKEEGIVPANTTFGTYLDQWLESTKGTVGPRTYQRAEETVRLHIVVPVVGSNSRPACERFFAPSPASFAG